MKSNTLRNVTVFTLIFLIIPVAIIIFTLNKPRSKSQTPSETGGYTISVTRSSVDTSVIDRELVDNLNKAWTKKTKSRFPIIQSVESFRRPSSYIESEYLGEYYGYMIFIYKKPAAMETQRVSVIANHNFITEEVLAYKDGEIFDLAELYADGVFTYSDISEMHDRLSEIFGYTHILNEVRDMKISVPSVHSLLFAEENEIVARNAIVETFLLKENGEAKPEDVYIIDFYGRYGNLSFFTYKSPFNYYECNLKYEEVGGEMFVYLNGNRIYGYDSVDDKLYTLTEAYEAKLLDESDLADIDKYHTAYYPLAIDLYGTDSWADPIDQAE